MAWFSDRTVALVRRNVLKTLTETCRVERESGSTGTMGELLHDWVVVAQDVACRVITRGQQSQAQTREVGGQEALVERYELICPVGTAFTVDDRVVMSDGRIFQVVDVEDGLSNEAFAKVMLVRTRGNDG